MKSFAILALLIAISFVLFALQNSAIITVSFLSLHYKGSLALILVVVFTSGLVSGILVSIPSLVRKSSIVREQRRRVRQLEERMTIRTDSHPAGQEKSDN
ncbi:MAG TPA: hypothetical protein DCP92_04685 [Nitrospiraceae bacterium]|jgi:uncharacterized integral membrane protein|nr:hypothetical protein [Nitrospiraceae bacterium]